MATGEERERHGGNCAVMAYNAYRALHDGIYRPWLLIFVAMAGISALRPCLNRFAYCQQPP